MTTLKLLLITALLPFWAAAQNIQTQPPQMPVDSIANLSNPSLLVQFMGGWMPDDITTSGFPIFSAPIWSAMNNLSLVTGATWTIVKQPAGAMSGSDPCDNTTWLSPTGDEPVGFAHEQGIAMFTPCSLDLYDPLGKTIEALAHAKANFVNRIVYNAGTNGFSPATALPMMIAKYAQDFSALGGCSAWNNLVNCSDRNAVSAPVELAAAKLGGTFIPIDQALGNLPIPTNIVGGENGMMVPVYNTLDNAVGSIAGKQPSTLMKASPANFIVEPAVRSALGFSTAGDPTDGPQLVAYPLGNLVFPNQADTVQTVMNPIVIQISMFDRTNGNTTGVTAPLKLTVSDATGNTIWSTSQAPTLSNFQIPLWSGSSPYTLTSCSVPYRAGWCPSSSLADGAYSAKVDRYSADSSTVEKSKTTFWGIDHSGWSQTPGTLIVFENGPDYATLNQVNLSLAGDSAKYSIQHYPGLAVVTGLPASYTEVALTDGVVTRLFPYNPGAIQNILAWKQFDDPLLLAGVSPMTGEYSGNVSPGTTLQLIGIGFSHNDPETLQSKRFRMPTEVLEDDNHIQVAFTWDGGQEFGEMTYVSQDEIDVIVPSQIPLGSTFSVGVVLNGTVSNYRVLTASSTDPASSIRRILSRPLSGNRAGSREQAN